MNCQFSVPKNYLGNTPEDGEYWNFSEIICDQATTTERFEVLETANNDYLLFDRSISTIDILTMYLSILIGLFLIFSFIFRLVYPFYFRYINKRFKN